MLCLLVWLWVEGKEFVVVLDVELFDVVDLVWYCQFDQLVEYVVMYQCFEVVVYLQVGCGFLGVGVDFDVQWMFGVCFDFVFDVGGEVQYLCFVFVLYLQGYCDEGCIVDVDIDFFYWSYQEIVVVVVVNDVGEQFYYWFVFDWCVQVELGVVVGYVYVDVVVEWWILQVYGWQVFFFVFGDLCQQVVGFVGIIYSLFFDCLGLVIFGCIVLVGDVVGFLGWCCRMLGNCCGCGWLCCLLGNGCWF